MGDTIDSLQIEITSSVEKSNAAIDRLQKQLDKLSTTMEKITSGVGYQNLNQLTQSLSAFSQLSIPLEISNSISSAASAVSKFGNAGVSKALTNIPYVTKFINDMSAELRGTSLNFNAESFNGLLDLMRKLGGVKATTGVSNIGQIGTLLKKLSSDLNGVSFNADLQGLPELTASLSKLGGKTATQAITNIPLMTTALKNMMRTLSTAPAVSGNVINMTNAMANLASQGQRVSSASNMFTNSISRTSHSAKRAIPTFGSLASKIGKFYANFFVFKRGFDALWKSIETGMDFIETYNYFDAAMDQVTSQLNGDWKEAGYASADEYFNAYKEEYKRQSNELTKKMTGFQVDSKGNLKNLGGISLGMDPDTVLNYQAAFSQLSSSMGTASDYAMKVSDAMTRLGADIASVKNLDFSETYEKLESSLVGMSRSADEFGVNIRDANLQAKALEIGVTASTKAMGQNDKELLRSIILLDSTRYAWADLADTLNQPSNQLRMLSSNFKTLSMTIGNIFLGTVAKTLPYVNALVLALQRLAQWVIDIFGIEIPTMTSQASGGISDLMGDMQDGIDDATGSAKKLKSQLLAIDELNVISSQDSTGTASAGGSVDTEKIQKAFDSIYDEYIKKWEEAYSRVENDSKKHADKIVSYFTEGKFTTLGRDIANNIERGLVGIDWSKIYKNADKFGSGSAEFLNGLFSPSMFTELGKFIAGNLNTTFHFVASFVRTFDWVNAGLSLSNMLNAFVYTFDEKELADAISGAIKGAIKAASTFLQKTDFEALGKKIGTFLKELDWKGILAGIGELICSAISAAFSAYDGLAEGNSMAAALVAIIGAGMTYKKFSPIIKSIAGFLGSSAATASVTESGAVLGSAVATGATGTGVLSSLSASAATIVTSFVGYLGGALAGAKIGDEFAKAIFGEEWALSNNWDTVFDYVFGAAERKAQEKTAEFAKEMQKAKAAYNEGLYYITESIGTSLPDLGIDDYSQQFIDFSNNIDTMLTEIGKANVPLNDYNAVFGFIKGSIGELDSATLKYIQTLSTNYNQLDEYQKAWLENKYGIDMYSDGLKNAENSANSASVSVANLSEVCKTGAEGLNANTLSATDLSDALKGAKASADDFEESSFNVKSAVYASTRSLDDSRESTVKMQVATEGLANIYGTFKTKSDLLTEGNYGLKASFSEFPSEMQKCIEKFEEASGTYTVYRTKADLIAAGNYAAKASFSELPSEMQKCIEAYEKSTGQSYAYSNMLDKVNSVTSVTSENANVLYGDMDEVSQSFENVSTITDTLSNEKMPNLKDSISEVTDVVESDLPTINATFSTELGHVKGTISDFGEWYKENFEVLFTKDHIVDFMSDFEPTMTDIFTNLGKTLQSTFNKLIDAINKSMKIEWDDVMVNGQKAVEAGKAQLINIPKIKAYATGGIVTADIFAANENGKPEYVGSFGSHTAVANNDQIVSGISDGVREAVTDVLMPILNDILGATEECASKEGITEDGILDASLRAAKTRARSTNRPVYIY